MPHSNDELDRLMAEELEHVEAAETEEDDGAPLPPQAVRNPRAKVLQVRLSQDEFDALERLAKERGLPVSTVARSQLLQLLAGAGEPDALTKLTSAMELVQDVITRLKSPEYAGLCAQEGERATQADSEH